MSTTPSPGASGAPRAHPEATAAADAGEGDARAAVAPVQVARGEDIEARLEEDGIALCLSGGGYRAMLFHLGTLWRLHELGLLAHVTRVSSVSGGSIVAGLLGLRWHALHPRTGAPGDVERLLVQPIRALASTTIDVGAVLGGVLAIGSVSDRVAKHYAERLYGGATLQDLPADPAPRFIINATSLQTGALWRFSRRYMGDYRVGLVREPRVPLAQAVAASSAFPPVLSPLRLDLPEGAMRRTDGADLHRPPFTTHVVLTDGGVYDNLGLETAWKRCRTVLVSDGGGRMDPEDDPTSIWPQQSVRVISIIDRQVRSLRTRQLIWSYERARARGRVAGGRLGCYWGIHTPLEKYTAPNLLPGAPVEVARLASVPTRLKALPDDLQERLINWGYASADASVRTFHAPGAPAPAGYPYPRGI